MKNTEWFDFSRKVMKSVRHSYRAHPGKELTKLKDSGNGNYILIDYTNFFKMNCRIIYLPKFQFAIKKICCYFEGNLQLNNDKIKPNHGPWYLKKFFPVVIWTYNQGWARNGTKKWTPVPGWIFNFSLSFSKICFNLKLQKVAKLPKKFRQASRRPSASLRFLSPSRH